MLAIGIGGNTLPGYYLKSSLRFRRSANAYLSRTPASTGNRKTFTFSLWFKGKGYYTGNDHLIGVNTSSTSYARVYYGTAGDNYLKVNQYVGGVNLDLITTQVLRDPSAWYHLVVAFDTTQATASNRIKMYLNGEQVTSFSTATYPSQNFDTLFNTTNEHRIGTLGATYNVGYEFDGYMTEVNFVDGQALTADDFGETNDNGVWSPIKYTGTYGTNGFYLPMKETTQATGFNTVLYTGTGASQSISNVGFSPDLVWVKERSAADNHQLADTVRGANKILYSDLTNAEDLGSTQKIQSFDSDGFTIGTSAAVNQSGQTYVGWCWDAGSSTVSNTDGTITSSVRANPATGFSILTYTGTGAVGTVGHGLGIAPSMIIVKNRIDASGWIVYNSNIGNTNYLALNATTASSPDSGTYWNSTSPTSSVFTVSTSNSVNGSGDSHVAYCFSEVAGYSKFGSYSGTGSAGNAITTGFRPAFVMIKKTNADANDRGWIMFDNTRDPSNQQLKILEAQSSAAEFTDSAGLIFTDTGFTINNAFINQNASGDTYIYMAFADTRDAQFNFDASGNKNNWTANNINSNASSETTYDIMNDVATLTDEDTGNFATLNPLNLSPNTTLSNGNLQFNSTAATSWRSSGGTIGVTSGKWYWEAEIGGTVSTQRVIGVYDPTTYFINYYTSSIFWDTGITGYGYYGANGEKLNNGSGVTYGNTYTNGDVIGVALDMDSGTLTFYKNGVAQGTAFTGLSGTLAPIVATLVSGSNINTNFGQRPFAYTPPTGYKKLNTYNLPDSTIKDGSQYMQTALYTGDGTNSRTIPLDFTPDMVWIKSRSAAYDHNIMDSLRDGKLIKPNSAGAEYTASDFFGPNVNVTTNGFIVGAGSNATLNGSGTTFVGWGWRGSDSTAVSNTDGTITSTVSANTTSGFSVVTYTSQSSGTGTIGHGLGVAPKVILHRVRSGGNWIVYHGSLGATKYMVLDQTGAVVTNSGPWNNTAPTSSVFTAGSWYVGSLSMLAYCFAEVEGFSKFGSYTGNGSADGTFVYTGFRPAFVLTKSATEARQWVIIDTSRDPYNLANKNQEITSSAEFTNADDLDILSNGFKPRTINPGANGNGQTIIYMAFAENPFKNSLAR